MDYILLNEQLKALTEDEPDLVCNLSNAAALLFSELDRLNWAGFYLVRGEELVLGPFQGKPACRRIRKNRGVCGTAWARGEIVLVKDVHSFPGHIACDSVSASEIVFPIKKDGKVVAVLDIDSPYRSRFGEEEERGLVSFVETLETLFERPEGEAIG
ncbi:MAG: GAF domain-containing protein [Clostridia bacterium]|nr:GAF domain-containing protein [Clostridia bacterium]